jgi:hypothetical protein
VSVEGPRCYGALARQGHLKRVSLPANFCYAFHGLRCDVLVLTGASRVLDLTQVTVTCVELQLKGTFGPGPVPRDMHRLKLDGTWSLRACCPALQKVCL